MAKRAAAGTLALAVCLSGGIAMAGAANAAFTAGATISAPASGTLTVAPGVTAAVPTLTYDVSDLATDGSGGSINFELAGAGSTGASLAAGTVTAKIDALATQNIVVAANATGFSVAVPINTNAGDVSNLVIGGVRVIGGSATTGAITLDSTDGSTYAGSSYTIGAAVASSVSVAPVAATAPLLPLGTGTASDFTVTSSTTPWTAGDSIDLTLPTGYYFKSAPKVTVSGTTASAAADLDLAPMKDANGNITGYQVIFQKTVSDTKSSVTTSPFKILVSGVELKADSSVNQFDKTATAVAVSVARDSGSSGSFLPAFSSAPVVVARTTAVSVDVPAKQSLLTTGGLQAIQPITISELESAAVKNGGTYQLVLTGATWANPNPTGDDAGTFTVKKDGLTGSTVVINSGDSQILDITISGANSAVSNTLKLSNLYVTPLSNATSIGMRLVQTDSPTLVAPWHTDVDYANAISLASTGDGRPFAGFDRYATSALVAHAAFQQMSNVDDVVIASGEVNSKGVDALSANYLAQRVNGPILLTQKGQVPSATFSELRAVLGSGPSYAGKTIHILGGANAVTAEAEKSLKDTFEDVTVVRYDGVNRYDTAARAVGMGGTDGIPTYSLTYGKAAKKTALVASGENPADALAAGPVAFAGQIPLLLTAKGSLSSETASALTGQNIKQVVLLGGTTAISAGVESSIEALGIEVVRVEGANRYETATKLLTLANKPLPTVAKPEGGMGLTLGYDNVANLGTLATEAYLVNGENFADALVAGPLAAVNNTALLTTAPSALSTSVSSWIADSKLTEVTAIGGTTAVPQAVVDQAQAAVN